MNIGQINFVLNGLDNYRKGNPITDVELDALIANHKQLLMGLDELNEERYLLFRKNITSDLSQFESYKESRKNR